MSSASQVYLSSNLERMMNVTAVVWEHIGFVWAAGRTFIVVEFWVRNPLGGAPAVFVSEQQAAQQAKHFDGIEWDKVRLDEKLFVASRTASDPLPQQEEGESSILCYERSVTEPMFFAVDRNGKIQTNVHDCLNKVEDEIREKQHAEVKLMGR